MRLWAVVPVAGGGWPVERIQSGRPLAMEFALEAVDLAVVGVRRTTTGQVVAALAVATILLIEQCDEVFRAHRRSDGSCVLVGPGRGGRAWKG